MSEIIKTEDIKNRIFTIRGLQVMIDRDLAQIYGVETKVLNQAVKRNIARFPESFRFQLLENEKLELVTNCDRFKKLKHSSVYPYAFTEQGVAMPSAVLRRETAIKVSITIIDDKTVYHFGASLKDAGKKWFACSKLSINANDIVEKL
ncbi:MAG: ORF6N domain-containing protein [Bacteroidota bacterium]|nr:ORF6N domain-containing protein [Bacteroidota bacterium]